MPHKRLIQKLRGYGIRGKTLDFLEDFLTNRKQQVVVGEGVSSWGSVTSGVPQGSVLGPVLFLIYVNELPALVKSPMKMFADDTKIFRNVCDRSDAQILQDDLNTLGQWSTNWLLKFNASKCKIMHLGSANPELGYSMMDANHESHELLVTECEKDLGVHITSSLKPTMHCHKAANKAMSALKLLRIAFNRINKNNFKLLYTTYVRPHLDYCAQAVGPYMVQDFQALERVQRRATKLVPEVRNLPYHDRLKRLSICSMEDRVLRGDLIETYKILTGRVKVNPDQFFERSQESRTRGHALKLKKRRALHQARSMFFANRVVTKWNNLPQEVVTAPSTNAFKARLDKHWAETQEEVHAN